MDSILYAFAGGVLVGGLGSGVVWELLHACRVRERDRRRERRHSDTEAGSLGRPLDSTNHPRRDEQ